MEKEMIQVETDAVRLKAPQCRKDILDIMKRYGYYDKVMSMPSNLDRVKEFLMLWKILNQHVLFTITLDSYRTPEFFHCFLELKINLLTIAKITHGLRILKKLSNHQK